MFEHSFTSLGKIVYDPYRGEMKSRTSWWCVVEVDKEITRYYRWWLIKEKHLVIHQPAWDAHISIIRGEKPHPSKEHLWKKYHGKKVNFKYEHGNIRAVKDKDQPGLFYWVDVDCPMLGDIRSEFGLPTGWRFHITIGRTYY